jgi:protein TonB
MQHLIATGEEIIVEPRVRIDLDIVRIKRDEVLDLKQELPEKIDKPVSPPRTIIDRTHETGGVGIRIPGLPARPPEPVHGLSGVHTGDGPLVSIMIVQPQYPIAAIRRAIEGTVLVQYDVTPLGTVANVSVVESSNSVFNKAAIDAAYRFKYKPRIIDGVPQETKGLRNLFRFEMEE